MIRSSKTVGSQTASASIPMDIKAVPFAVGFGVVVSGGASLSYDVQHTFDNIYDSSVTPTWFNHAAVTAQTTSQDGNYAFPVTAIRLNVGSWTSGTATLTVIQGTQ